jgi:hypothetical protein
VVLGDKPSLAAGTAAQAHNVHGMGWDLVGAFPSPARQCVGPEAQPTAQTGFRPSLAENSTVPVDISVLRDPAFPKKAPGPSGDSEMASHPA